MLTSDDNSQSNCTRENIAIVCFTYLFEMWNKTFSFAFSASFHQKVTSISFKLHKHTYMREKFSRRIVYSDIIFVSVCVLCAVLRHQKLLFSAFLRPTYKVNCRKRVATSAECTVSVFVSHWKHLETYEIVAKIGKTHVQIQTFKKGVEFAVAQARTKTAHTRETWNIFTRKTTRRKTNKTNMKSAIITNLIIS